MNVYVTSDIHANFDLFKSSIPSDADKIILNGDMFNKGYQNRDIFLWLLSNVNNKKIIHIFGNHEILLVGQLYKELNDLIGIDTKYDIYRICDKIIQSDSGYQRDKIFNITKIVSSMVRIGVVKFEEITKYFNNMYFYYKQELGKNTWYISHAGWVPFKDEISEYNLKEIKIVLYDWNNYTSNALKNGNDPKFNAYIKFCKKFNRYHVFGHFPTNKLFHKNAPVILHDRFIYVDPDVVKTKRILFFKLWDD